VDVKNVFIAANEMLTGVVHQIKEDDWDISLPEHARYKDDQTIRDIVNICAYENQCVPAMLAGANDLKNNFEMTEDILGDNWLDAYTQLANTANKAVEQQTSLDQTVHMSYGDFPADRYLNDICVQRSAVAYDVAALIGVEAHLPEEAVAGLLPIVEEFAPYLRENGIFPPAIEVDDDASPEQKLMAFMGRQPYCNA